jgi:hypothetical protein
VARARGAGDGTQGEELESNWAFNGTALYLVSRETPNELITRPIYVLSKDTRIQIHDLIKKLSGLSGKQTRMGRVLIGL